MSKLYEANAAVDLLMATFGMTEDDALFALDFAEDSGLYAGGSFSVTCMGRGVFEIERR